MKENKNPNRLNISAPAKCNITKVRELAMQYKSGAVFIDYIQLMKDVNNAKEKRHVLGNIANDAKALAKELEIPVFFIVQANRTSIDEVPTGDHIKESDEIGAAADIGLIDLDPFDRLHLDDIIGRMRPGDQRFQLAQIDFHGFGVFGVGVRL